MLIVIDALGNPAAIGNGFVVKANGRSAICLTASHNFDDPSGRKRSGRSGSHPTMPDVFKSKGPHILDSKNLYAHYRKDGASYLCPVEQVNFVENYDVAVFTIHTPNGADAVFEKNLFLDLRMPTCGDEIALLTYQITSENDPETPNEASLIVTESPYFLLGKVTHSELQPNRQKMICTFETTIPIRKGMSGSPILVKPSEENIEPYVCGVVSSDFSEEDAFTDFRVSGMSSATALFPSLGLAIFLGDGVESPRYYLSEFLERDWLGIREGTMRVDVEHTSQTTRIIYRDLISEQQLEFVYEMSAHPSVVPKR